MKSLEDFSVPRNGELTICEIDGLINTASHEYSNVNIFTNTIEKHPKIHITRDVLHNVPTHDDIRAFFLPVDTPFLMHLTEIYYEQGFKEALYTASSHTNFFISVIAKFILKGYTYKNKIFNHYLKDDNTNLIREYCQTRAWKNDLITCISWNPYSTKIAVAAVDDIVRIYSNETSFVPLLKCKQQKNITCIAWRPLSISEIAVGCENCIIVWNIDPNSVMTRPSMSNAIILHRIHHKPIISLTWSPRGDMLASSALCDSTIYIWNVELDHTSSLKRSSRKGNVLLKWSPTGDKLLAATDGIVFRVWDCHSWNAERWTILSGRVQSACWLPCGTVLFFATNEEPVLYSLTFANSDIVFALESNNASNTAAALFDLTKIDIDGVMVGGIVQSMETDINGNHLAIVFHDTNCIAVFNIHKQPILQILASSLVIGLPEEKPTAISFQNNFNCGSCLSIGWSSGRIQHYPIVYTDVNVNRSINIHSASFNNQSLYTSFSSFNHTLY